MKEEQIKKDERCFPRCLCGQSVNQGEGRMWEWRSTLDIYSSVVVGPTFVAPLLERVVEVRDVTKERMRNGEVLLDSPPRPLISPFPHCQCFKRGPLSDFVGGVGGGGDGVGSAGGFFPSGPRAAPSSLSGRGGQENNAQL